MSGVTPMELTRTERYKREVLHSLRKNNILMIPKRRRKHSSRLRSRLSAHCYSILPAFRIVLGLPPDFAEQGRHEGVGGTAVPCTREKTESRVGALPARGFDAEEDQRSRPQAQLSDPGAVPCLAEDAFGSAQRPRDRILRIKLLEIAPRLGELPHEPDRLHDVLHRETGGVCAGGVATGKS